MKNSARVPIRGEDGMFATVDAEDMKRVSMLEWRLSSKGEPKAAYPDPDHPTVRTSITLKSFVLGVRVKGNRCVKNLDGDVLNCRKSNLREMSVTEARALDRKNLGPPLRRTWTVKKDIRKVLGTLKPPKPEPSFNLRNDGVRRRLVQVSVSVDLMDQMKAVAASARRSVSDLAEEAIRDWLTKRP